MWKCAFAGGLIAGACIFAGCDKPSESADKNSETRSPRAASDTPTVADPKQVAFDPKKYVGKTLRSDLRLTGFGQDACGFTDPISNAHVFFLKSPNQDVTDKLVRASQIAGNYGSVTLTYKLDADPPTDGRSIGTVIDVAMK